MVVKYPTGTEGSWASFFIHTPRVIFAARGSVLRGTMPQVLIATTISILATCNHKYWNWFDHREVDLSAISLLLSFVVVFKTQSAYQQFWTAYSHVDGMLHDLRCLARSAVCNFHWDNGDTERLVKRLLRYELMFFFVVIEYFGRTGPNATTAKKRMDRMRDDIRRISKPTEWYMLYAGEDFRTFGSKSVHSSSNPQLVLCWLQMVLAQIEQEKGIPHPPYSATILSFISAIETHFWEMEKIDKLQFPLPYAQIVKILMIIYIFTLPWNLVSKCGWATPVIMFFTALGFFGLDEVAEILESPFGFDPNDIDLRDFGYSLADDIEVYFVRRDEMRDAVLGNDGDDQEPGFESISEGKSASTLGDKVKKPSWAIKRDGQAGMPRRALTTASLSKIQDAVKPSGQGLPTNQALSKSNSCPIYGDTLT